MSSNGVSGGGGIMYESKIGLCQKDDLKIHTSTRTINDVRINFSNPFKRASNLITDIDSFN